MVYSTESAKWKAYQFSDPFAAGSFFVCNKINRFFCRPDCDARPTTNLKSEIKFLSQTSDALNLGYIPCEHCDPLHSTAIDVQLLIKCVATTNKNIGFMPPLLDENEETNTRKIKENIYETKKQNEENIMKTINGSTTQRNSQPILNYQGKASKDLEHTSLSKNDSDHYRLVDLACRHLALAAAVNVFQPKPIPVPEETNTTTNTTGSPTTTKKRRRRGGVLGFKELAAKSKLSAWHFHRVFKSVTGLTPKTYGDKCWEFIKKVKESGEYTSFEILNNSPMNLPSHSRNVSLSSPKHMKSSPTSPDLQQIPKPIKVESLPNLYTSSHSSNNTPQQLNQPIFDSLSTTSSNSYPITPSTQINNIPDYTDPSLSSAIETELNNFQHLDNGSTNGDEFSFNYPNKAFSFPDLSKFRTDTLFNHTQPFKFNNNQIIQSQPSHPQENINGNQEIFSDIILPSSTSLNSTNNNSMAQFGVFEDLSQQPQPQQQPLEFGNNTSNVPLYMGDDLDLLTNSNFDDSLFNSFTNNPNNLISAGTNDELSYQNNDYLSMNPQLASSIGL